MGDFITAAVSYPTAVYTTLLGVVLIYWLLAIVGIVDFDSSGVDLDLDAHAEGSVTDIGVLAGYVVAMGLNGVPFSIAVSLLVLLGWMLSCLAGMWLLPLVPTTGLQLLAGTGVLLGSFAVAVPITARLVRPLRGLFITHNAERNMALIGESCRVVTGSVDERFGRAEIKRRGASLNIRVWAHTPNALTKGSAARIVDYDEANGRYLIEPQA